MRCVTCGIHSNDAGWCGNCGQCENHCECPQPLFDADELGLDPETDNTPDTESRHA